MVDRTTHVICLNCECGVLQLDGTPCPNCHRCPFCWRKVKADQARCCCDDAQDPEEYHWYATDHIVPEDQVAREKRRMGIRKKLESKLGIASGVLGGLLCVSINVVRDTFGTSAILTATCCVTVWFTLLWMFKWYLRRVEERRLAKEYCVAHETRSGE